MHIDILKLLNRMSLTDLSTIMKTINLGFRKAYRELINILLQSDMKLTRLILAGGAIFIGLGFMWPVDIFPTVEQIASGNGRHTYALMAQIAPEWLWGTAFLLQGGVMLWALVWDQRNRFFLVFDATFGVLLWTVAILACYFAYWRGFGRIMEYRPPAIMGGEFTEMLASWLLFVRYQLEPYKPELCPMTVTERPIVCTSPTYHRRAVDKGEDNA